MLLCCQAETTIKIVDSTFCTLTIRARRVLSISLAHSTSRFSSLSFCNSRISFSILILKFSHSQITLSIAFKCHFLFGYPNHLVTYPAGYVEAWLLSAWLAWRLKAVSVRTRRPPFLKAKVRVTWVLKAETLISCKMFLSLTLAHRRGLRIRMTR